MKKLIIFLIALAGLTAQSWAYDFSYTYQGQTLYYNIVGGNAEVTYYQYEDSSYTNLTGSLTIPSTVTNNGTTYSVTSIGNYAFYGCTGLCGSALVYRLFLTPAVPQVAHGEHRVLEALLTAI